MPTRGRLTAAIDCATRKPKAPWEWLPATIPSPGMKASRQQAASSRRICQHVNACVPGRAPHRAADSGNPC